MAIFIPAPLPISVQTVAELATSKARTADGGVLQVSGHSTAGDNGGSERVYRRTGRSSLPAAVLNGVCFAGPGTDDYHELCDKSFLNVRSFGAHPANTASQNHAAFQKAIDAAKSLYFSNDVDGYDGPTIYIPNGIYEISQSLIIDQSVGRIRFNMHGQDMFGTVIIKANTFTGDTLIDVTNVTPGSSGTYAQFWHWSKMQLIGKAADNSKVDYIFRCPALIDSHFQDIYFNGANYACLRIGDAWINKFDRCWIFNGGLCGQIQDSSNCNACIWVGCIFGNAEVGLHMQGGIQNSILGCTIENNSRTGIYLDRSTGFVIQSYFEANGEGGHVIRTIDSNPLRPLITCTANAGTDVITATAHGLTNRKPVSFTNAGGTLPAPLAINTDYYVYAVTTNTFKLATTYLNAKNEVGINITDTGTGTHYVSRNWRITANIITNGTAYGTTNGELPTNMSAAFATNTGTIQGVIATTDQAPKTLVAILAAHNLNIQQQANPTIQLKTKGSITSGTKILTMESTSGFLRYRYYRIAGAGPSGADYLGMSDNVDSGTQITMRDNASTTVTNAVVEMIPDSIIQMHGAHGSASGLSITGMKGYGRIEFEVPTTNNSYGIPDIHTADISFAPRTVLRLQPEFTELIYAGGGVPYLSGLTYADRREWVFDYVAGGAVSETHGIYFDLMQTPELIGQLCVAEVAWICLDREGDALNTNGHTINISTVSDLGAGTASTNNVDQLATGTVKTTATTTATSKVIVVTDYASDFAVGRYVVIRSAGVANQVAFTATHGTDTINANGHGLANDDGVIFTGVDLPAGLSQGVMYFLINKAANTFQVAATVGGAAINITDNGSGTMTFSKHRAFAANPANDVITATAHGLANEATVLFTGATLPTGLSQGVMYFVKAATTDTFEVELSIGGGTVNITGAGSGVMTFATHDLFYSRVASVSGSNVTLTDAVPTTLTSAVPILSPGISYARMTFQLPTDPTLNRLFLGVYRTGGSKGSRSVILDGQIKAIGNPVGVMDLPPLVPQEVTTVTKPYHAITDGVTDTRSILVAYDTTMAGLSKNVVVATGTHYIGSTTAFTAIPEFRLGGIYRPAAGVTVTLANYIAHDDQQVFDVKTHSGNIAITGREYVTAKHYGALGDGTTDDYVPIVVAYQLSNGAKVRFTPGVYVVGTNIGITSEVHFEHRASIKPSNGIVVTINKYTYDGDWPFDTSAGGSFVFAKNADGNLGASHTFVCDEGGDGIKTGTLTADVAITLSASRPGWFSIVLTQNGTGGWVVSSYVTTIVGTPPTIAAAPGAKTLLPLRYDGTTWFWM